MGQMLCAFYAEMRSIIPMVYEKDVARFLVRLELFLEVYQYFTCRIREDNLQPKAEDVKDILYWYISDYSDAETEKRIEAQVCPLKNVAYRIVKEADLSNAAYLYQYGEYVTSNEVETARYINSLPEETICRMAAAFTEGFRRGFEVAGKDLSRKKTVNIRYSLGFERVVRMAVAQFAKMGLEPVLYRAATDVFARRGMRIGYYGAISHWFDFDMIAYLSSRFPQHDIVLIGDVVAGAERLNRLNNVQLLGVMPYGELPNYLKTFDVCLIPFDASIDLIKATNPVKFYEYLSAGKKIVATEIPELEPFRSRYAYLANDQKLFGDYVEQCLNGSDTLASPEEAMAFAKENDWDNRFRVFADLAKSCFPIP
jgi:glycosyltransferase involved in cell wall biosynthesis